MEYTDTKPRKLKRIGNSFHVIFNMRKAKEKGLIENNKYYVTLREPEDKPEPK